MMMRAEDTLRDVNVDGYRLEMYATTRRDHRGQTTIGYRFTSPNGVLLFAGEDFHGSPMSADDSDETVRGLLSFLTLRPGDTDDEYFAHYTEAQMEFAVNVAEGLHAYSYDEEPEELREWVAEETR